MVCCWLRGGMARGMKGGLLGQTKSSVGTVRGMLGYIGRGLRACDARRTIPGTFHPVSSSLLPVCAFIVEEAFAGELLVFRIGSSGIYLIVAEATHEIRCLLDISVNRIYTNTLLVCVVNCKRFKKVFNKPDRRGDTFKHDKGTLSLYSVGGVVEV